MPKYSTIFLDLDDTLYPRSNGLWDAIGARIESYLVDRFGLTPAAADKMRAQYLQEYGTTLNGLIEKHNTDPADYLEYVHKVPTQDFLEPDPELGIFLSRLDVQRIIFTNASRAHADRVLDQLGITNQIDAIIDIERMEFRNKPRPEAYRRAMIIAHEPDPSACVLVDDRAENLQPAADLGMTTVHVGEHEQAAIADYHISRCTELTLVLPELLKSGRSVCPNNG